MATVEQLEAALRKADAAGNVDDARQLASAIRSMRTAAPAAAPAKPDFGGVKGSVNVAATDPNAFRVLQESDPNASANYEKWRTESSARDYAQMPWYQQAAIGLGEPVDRAIRGIGGLVQGDTPQMREMESKAREFNDATVKSTAAGNTGRFAGDVALTAGPMGKGIKGAMAVGALYGGLQPVAEDESRLTNAGIGAGAAWIGGKAGNALSGWGERAAKAIPQETRRLYELAKSHGITLTPAQLSDSKALKFIQSQLERMPIIGGSKKTEQQIAQFNRELAKTIGEDADVVTPEVYAAAKKRMGREFEDLTGRNSLDVSPDLLRRLEAIRSEAALAGDDAQKAVGNALDSIYARLGTGVEGGAQDGTTSALMGGMPGRAYQALDSQLGQVTKLGTPASHFVGQIRSAMRGAMDDSITPADSAAWKTLRQQYGNRKTLRDLVAKGDGGPISPASLMGRVNANNAGKEAMASGGRGELGELARIGQRIKEPPSSGTAERLSPVLLGAAGATNLPLTLAALLGGSAVKKGLDSDFLARLLLAEGRGEARKALAPIVRAGGVAATPAATETKRKDTRKRK
ncbi:hypothetical protein [Noviluteimonas gilva]|uniref:Uncharacterized protein n=1 Tax=Noviluteimonas gilva TaxID=2682097 RepID=A0A7C9HLI9_9GAMM|nr:hypothetical protein [Lysobacter gilvus]MUV13596.1 hypothetical protein [Lysobacter gilvus]